MKKTREIRYFIPISTLKELFLSHKRIVLVEVCGFFLGSRINKKQIN